MPKCEELVKNIYPKSIYQLRETLFDKLRAFHIEVADGDTLFNNFAVFEFDSICVKNSKLVNTETTTWVGKHELISVSTTSNLLEEPIFICHTELYSIVSAFVNSVESLAEKNKRDEPQISRYCHEEKGKTETCVVSHQHDEETVIKWKRTARTLGGYG